MQQLTDPPVVSSDSLVLGNQQYVVAELVLRYSRLTYVLFQTVYQSHRVRETKRRQGSLVVYQRNQRH